VRLFTAMAMTETGRYPLIIEAALKNRQTSFVIAVFSDLPGWN
jgi:hypothetical protein